MGTTPAAPLGWCSRWSPPCPQAVALGWWGWGDLVVPTLPCWVPQEGHNTAITDGDPIPASLGDTTVCLNPALSAGLEQISLPWVLLGVPAPYCLLSHPSASLCPSPAPTSCPVPPRWMHAAAPVCFPFMGPCPYTLHGTADLAARLHSNA